ncbi:siderophore-interacting protein [Enterobacter cloacae subsp. cloacae]
MATTRYPQRVRNELRFRELTVLRVERVSAGFQRIVLGGEALEGFSSRGFDDHAKCFFRPRERRLCHRWSPTRALTGATACARKAGITRRCTTPRSTSWRLISSCMTAGLPASGR